MVEMPEYTALLNDAGYETEEDMVNLKRLDEKELRMMGITKRGQYFLLVLCTAPEYYILILTFLQLT